MYEISVSIWRIIKKQRINDGEVTLTSLSANVFYFAMSEILSFGKEFYTHNPLFP